LVFNSFPRPHQTINSKIKFYIEEKEMITDKRGYGSSYFQATDWFLRLTQIFGQMPGLVNRVQRMPAFIAKLTLPQDYAHRLNRLNP
jgi:hypothetical protein